MMQEPGDLRKIGTFNLADHMPVGYVISQEAEAPHRVKVRIPAKHRELSDEDLPWFRVGFGIGLNGHNGRSGKFTTLAHGTEVIVLLYDQLGYNGIVIFQLANQSNDIQGEDDVYGYRDELGNSFRVNTDGVMTMQDKTGSTVSMGNGVVSVEADQLYLRINDITIESDTLGILSRLLNMTATDLAISATNPTIVDGAGGGGGAGTGPTLTPPELPEAPDFNHKTDL
jgi:hypothetical protein